MEEDNKNNETKKEETPKAAESTDSNNAQSAPKPKSAAKQKKVSKRSFGQKKRYTPAAQTEFRLRMPREGEMFALAKTILGGSRIQLQCEDGKERMGRIIGKMRKRFWIREGDIVIIRTWAFTTADDKAEIKWKYTPTQKGKLQRQGRLEWLTQAEEKEFEL